MLAALDTHPQPPVLDVIARQEVGMATVAERVNNFLTAHDAPACDTCVQRALWLPQHNQVQQVTSALATTREFERGKGKCSLCRKNVTVSWRVAGA